MAVVNKNFVIKNGLEVDGNTLVVDATNNRVGINSSTPSVSLDIIGEFRVGNASNKLTFGGDNGRNIEIGVGNTSTSSYIDFHTADNVDPDFSARIEKGAGLNGNFTFANKGTGSYSFYSGATEQLTLTSSGNVGIGTTNPSSLLQLGASGSGSYSYLKLTGAGSTNRFYRFITPANKATVSGVADTTQSLYLGRFYNGVHKIQMYVSGNNLEEGISLTLFKEWGVGSVPSITSEEGSDLSEITFHYQNIDNDSYHVFISFTWAVAAPQNAAAQIRLDITSISSLGTFDVPATPTIPTLNASNQILPRFIITSSGNIGIGTTNPTAKLSLIGGTDPVLDVVQSTSGTARWVIKARTSGIAANNESGIYQDVFNNLQFAGRDGNGALRVLLDSNSNSPSYINSTAGFGIGTASTVTGYTSLATNLRLGISTKAGTYSQSGTTITVTCANHGLNSNDSVFLDFTSGTAVDNYFSQIVVVNSSTFTVTAPSLTTSGNVTIYPETQLRFPGAYGDGNNSFDHTVISERLWGGADKSELLIFKGNDTGTTIQDNIRLAAAGDIYFHSGVGVTTYGGYITNHGGTVASSTVSIRATGNVGIATTQPLARLSIGSGSINDGNVPVQISAPTGGLAYYGANNNGAYGALFGYDSTWGGAAVRATGATDNLNLVVNNTNRAVVINSSGNVGVGVTNPTTRLHVIGRAWLQPNTTGALDIALSLGRFSDSASAAYDILTDDVVGDDLIIRSNRYVKNIKFTRGSPTGEQGSAILYSHYQTGTYFSIFDLTGTTTKISLNESGNSFFNNTGNFGIGLTNPGSKLAVNGYITENPGDGTYWNVVSQKDIGFAANQVPLNQYLGQLAFADTYSPSGLRRDGGGIDDVVVNSTGLVGIGTTTPVDHIELYKTGGLNPRILFHHQGQASYKVGVHGLVFKIAGMDNGVGGHTADFANSNTQVISLTNTGLVGIGHTNPLSRLHIVGDATDTHGTLKVENTKNGGGMYFPAASFINSYANHNYGIVAEFKTITGPTTGYDTPSILFYSSGTSNSWSVGQTNANWGVDGGFGIGYRASNNPDGFNSWPSSYVSITTTGNVGIGLTNPSDKLQVSGTINASSDISLGGELNFYTPSSKFIDFYTRNAGGTNFAAHLRLVNHDSTVFQTGTRMFYGGAVELYHNNAKRLETTTGGIYVEGSALGSTVGNTVTLASFFHNNGNASYLNIVSTRVNTTQTWAGSSTKIVNITDVTSQGYIEFNPNGSLYGIAFGQGGVEFARFLSTGNLGIGTTNPIRKLHVEGTSTFSSNVRVGTVIEQVPYDSLNSGTLSWEGSAGQLFSITNNLTTGSIFSVNDVSGIPSIDVDANGTIELAPFGGNVGIGTTNPTHALDVNSNSIRVRTAQTPASATAAGTQGQICWDSNYIYVCIATNTWRRTAISAW